MVGRKRYELTPGWLVGLSGSYRVVDGDGYAPFVLLGLAAGVSSVTAERGDEGAECATLGPQLIHKEHGNGQEEDREEEDP